LLNYLRHRAAAVDIHDIRAGLLDHYGCIDHAIYRVSEDLNRERSLYLLITHHPQTLLILPRHPFDADEFGHEQTYRTGICVLYQTAEPGVGDPRHWGEGEV